MNNETTLLLLIVKTISKLPGAVYYISIVISYPKISTSPVSLSALGHQCCVALRLSKAVSAPFTGTERDGSTPAAFEAIIPNIKQTSWGAGTSASLLMSQHFAIYVKSSQNAVIDWHPPRAHSSFFCLRSTPFPKDSGERPVKKDKAIGRLPRKPRCLHFCNFKWGLRKSRVENPRKTKLKKREWGDLAMSARRSKHKEEVTRPQPHEHCLMLLLHKADYNFHLFPRRHLWFSSENSRWKETKLAVYIFPR